MRLATGARFGAYEILALLGMGGMGEVYLARDTRLKRDVALKVVQPAFLGAGGRVARFEREAELLAAVNHPNIAAIYGTEESDGVTALVLELVEGPTLADRLRGGPLTTPEVLDICRQLVDALDAAHERGIVHRDLKPANIKIREDGTVKVLDFGLAKALDPDDVPAPAAAALATVTSPVLTSMGVILGTAAYMSPEQARGQSVDKRTDIWAFGCVLYEMLTGRMAFARSTAMDSVAAVLEREPDWSALPAATPRSLRRLLLRCLEKNRSQRLRDIADARDALADARDDGAEASPSRATSRRRLVAGAVALAGAAAVTTAVVMTLLDTRRGGDSGTPGPRFTRVTADASYSTEPALSRDGTMVAYASDRSGGGQLDLWLQRTAGGQPIPLTTDPADDREPDFSPDGSLIVFRADRGGGGVYVMSALGGGNARLVAEGGRRPRFSPDGSRITYWAGPWLSGAGSRGPAAVFTVPANGGQPTRIAEGFVTARDPIWSPDGKSLLFFGRKAPDNSPAGSFDWWWAPLDGREPVATGAYPLLAQRGIFGAGDSDVTVVRLEPSPKAWTGSGVLFSAAFGHSVSVWRLNVSAATGQVQEASLDRLTSGSGFALAASADLSGRIAFQAASEGYASLMLPLDANAGRPTGPIVRQTYWAVGGGRNSIDRAGRLLAYQKSQNDGTELWIKDLQTGQERHLVTTPLGNINPVIAGDGSQVAYSVVEGSRVAGHVIPASGGTPRQICECTLQGWLPDNRRILALDGFGPSRRVRAIDAVDRSDVELLAQSTPTFGRVDASPDGRWLALSSSRHVWIAPIRPGDPPAEKEWSTVLNKTPESAERACGWSPDSGLLYLLLERDGFRDLYAQRIDPNRGTAVGAPFVVQHLHDPQRRWGSTSFGNAISASAFVFSQVETTGSIWLMEPGQFPVPRYGSMRPQ